MKKILLFTMMLIAGRCANAQTGTLYINNNTDYVVKVTVYAYSGTYCSVPCVTTDYATKQIKMSWYTTWGPYDPYTICGGLGFVASCTSGCTALPSDFQWTWAEIDIPSASCSGGVTLYVGDNGIGCYGTPTSVVSCGFMENFYATWSPATGSALSDVSIDIEEY
jgi:hypothetical protein